MFELNPRYPLSETDPVNAFREVYHYGRALRLWLDGAEGLPLSLRLVRRLHEILLDGVRGADSAPGDFRRLQNQIGRPARFVPPPPDRLAECLGAFESSLHAERRYDPLVEAFLAHYQFETIHPFRDGNGRVGRLLLAITIKEWCGLSNQWLYMSAYFDKNKDSYIDLLYQVSAVGAWESWITFCLKGVVEQAMDAQKRCDRLLALLRDYKERVRSLKGSNRVSAIVDDLFRTPAVQVTELMKRFNVTYPTAHADMKKLQAAGIVAERRIGGVRTYVAGDLLSISFDDID